VVNLTSRYDGIIFLISTVVTKKKVAIARVVEYERTVVAAPSSDYTVVYYAQAELFGIDYTEHRQQGFCQASLDF
jgi:hypothetical protein